MSVVNTDVEQGVVVVSEVEDAAIVDGVARDEEFWSEHQGANWMEPVRRALASWAEDLSSPGKGRKRSIFDRDRYVTPGKIFEQMAMAEDAMDDDVVDGIYDVTESMAFKKMTIETEDEDQADVWGQIARDLNLDGYLRTVWRELFKVSQYYGVVWWSQKTYRVRGEGDGGRKRRKEFNIRAPVGLGVMDPLRVVPVAFDIFGNHSLAWIADKGEMETFTSDKKDRVLGDALVEQLFLGKYTPSQSELQKLKTEDIPVDRLILLNPENTWMGSLTKATYERWARVRMKSVLPLLDMKHQLREMDRAFLIGGINFIVLVKKGTDTHPVQKASEVTAVANQMKTQAKSSVIVSDHRLEIEIITPDLEHILSSSKYSVLDDRIRLRLLGGLAPPADTGNRESQITLAKIVALGIENRRHMIKRDIEAAVLRATADRNSDDFDDTPSIEYLPRRLDMLFDPQVATELQSIRDRGELSRQTFLEEFMFDLSLEKKRREREKEAKLDDIFQPVQVPFDSPGKLGGGNQPPGESPGAAGRRGGGSPQEQPDRPSS